MKPEYRTWLEEQKYAPNTIVAQMHRAGRVEEYHGDLDEHYSTDRLASLIDLLRYSTDDARRGRPNPSKVPFEGDIRNNLASYRNAVERYKRYLDLAAGLENDASSQPDVALRSPEVDDGGQRIALERDMQMALRRAIESLEHGLQITDEGAERSVDSGFIDITARDASGATVVIELKAGVARRDAVAQILSYMGDVMVEEDGRAIRGILVAADFDSKAQSAARMVPGLSLRKYSIRFTFADGFAR